MRRGGWPLLLLMAALAACGASRGPIPVAPGAGVAVDGASALAFQERATGFYQRLVQRRFDALETFNDPVLREHFRSEDLFFDYYADLATALHDAHFEKSRPAAVAIEEFVFESADRVAVQVRFLGGDNRPLRPDRTSLVRLDRWERREGGWWVTPGKL